MEKHCLERDEKVCARQGEGESRDLLWAFGMLEHSRGGTVWRRENSRGGRWDGFTASPATVGSMADGGAWPTSDMFRLGFES